MVKRYRLIGDKMVERPQKGEWVLWDEVKFLIDPKKYPKEPKADGTDSNDKRSS